MQRHMLRPGPAMGTLPREPRGGLEKAGSGREAPAAVASGEPHHASPLPLPTALPPPLLHWGSSAKGHQHPC